MTRPTRRPTVTSEWDVTSYGPIRSTRAWMASWPLTVAGILLTTTIPAKAAVIAAFALWTVVVGVWNAREFAAWCDVTAPDVRPVPDPIEVLVPVAALDAVADSPAETEPAPALALEARTR